MRSYFTWLIAALFTIATTSAQSNDSTDQKFNDHFEIVEKLISQASENNGLWRDTKHLSSQAKELAASNNEQATNLLLEAEFQAKLGFQQAAEQSDIDQLVPHYLHH